MRLRWFLSMTAILMAAAGATLILDERLGNGGQGVDQVVGAPVGPDGEGTSTTTEPGSGDPPEGQLRVHGTVTAVHLEGAVLDPREVATPLTIVAERGLGNGGELTGVIVEGRPASVVWDGGRPFVLASGGALMLDPVVVDLTPDGLRLGLAGTPHGLAPGTYRLDTPVAVGTVGVAAARDSVTFEADGSSAFEGRGDAALVLPPAGPRRLLGPGSVRLEGALELTDAAGTRTRTRLDGVAVAFDLTLTPVEGGGWAITGTLRGDTDEA